MHSQNIKRIQFVTAGRNWYKKTIICEIWNKRREIYMKRSAKNVTLKYQKIRQIQKQIQVFSQATKKRNKMCRITLFFYKIQHSYQYF